MITKKHSRQKNSQSLISNESDLSQLKLNYDAVKNSPPEGSSIINSANRNGDHNKKTDSSESKGIHSELEDTKQKIKNELLKEIQGYGNSTGVMNGNHSDDSDEAEDSNANDINTQDNYHDGEEYGGEDLYQFEDDDNVNKDTENYHGCNGDGENDIKGEKYKQNQDSKDEQENEDQQEMINQQELEEGEYMRKRSYSKNKVEYDTEQPNEEGKQNYSHLNESQNDQYQQVNSQGFQGKNDPKNRIMEFYKLQKIKNDININDYIELEIQSFDFKQILPEQELFDTIMISNISSENVVVNLKIYNNSGYIFYIDEMREYQRGENFKLLENQSLQLLIASLSTIRVIIIAKGRSLATPDQMTSHLALTLQGFPAQINVEKQEQNNSDTQQNNGDDKEESKSNNENYIRVQEEQVVSTKSNGIQQNQNRKKKGSNNSSNDSQFEGSQCGDYEELIDDKQRQVVIPLMCKVVFPQIMCPKAMLYNEMRVIKVACKLNVPQTEIRVGFQIKDYNHILDIDFIDDNPNDFLTIRSRPMQTLVDQQGGFLVNLVMRPNYTNIKKFDVKIVKKILLLKIKSLITYSFPIIIEIY